MTCPSVCRVCLADNSDLYHVSKPLLVKYYKKLSGLPLKRRKYPETLCRVCLKELKKCCRFMETARKSNKALGLWVYGQIELKHAKSPLYKYTTSVIEQICVSSLSSDAPSKVENDECSGLSQRNYDIYHSDSDDNDASVVTIEKETLNPTEAFKYMRNPSTLTELVKSQNTDVTANNTTQNKTVDIKTSEIKSEYVRTDDSNGTFAKSFYFSYERSPEYNHYEIGDTIGSEHNNNVNFISNDNNNEEFGVDVDDNDNNNIRSDAQYINKVSPHDESSNIVVASNVKSNIAIEEIQEICDSEITDYVKNSHNINYDVTKKTDEIGSNDKERDNNIEALKAAVANRRLIVKLVRFRPDEYSLKEKSKTEDLNTAEIVDIHATEKENGDNLNKSGTESNMVDIIMENTYKKPNDKSQDPKNSMFAQSDDFQSTVDDELDNYDAVENDNYDDTEDPVIDVNVSDVENCKDPLNETRKELEYVLNRDVFEDVNNFNISTEDMFKNNGSRDELNVIGNNSNTGFGNENVFENSKMQQSSGLPIISNHEITEVILSNLQTVSAPLTKKADATQQNRDNEELSTKNVSNKSAKRNNYDVNNDNINEESGLDVDDNDNNNTRSTAQYINKVLPHDESSNIVVASNVKSNIAIKNIQDICYSEITDCVKNSRINYDINQKTDKTGSNDRKRDSNIEAFKALVANRRLIVKLVKIPLDEYSSKEKSKTEDLNTAEIVDIHATEKEIGDNLNESGTELNMVDNIMENTYKSSNDKSHDPKNSMIAQGDDFPTTVGDEFDNSDVIENGNYDDTEDPIIDVNVSDVENCKDPLNETREELKDVLNRDVLENINNFNTSIEDMSQKNGSRDELKVLGDNSITGFGNKNVLENSKMQQSSGLPIISNNKITEVILSNLQNVSAPLTKKDNPTQQNGDNRALMTKNVSRKLTKRNIALKRKIQTTLVTDETPNKVVESNNRITLVKKKTLAIKDDVPAKVIKSTEKNTRVRGSKQVTTRRKKLANLSNRKQKDIATTTRIDVNKSRQSQHVGNTEEKSEAKKNLNKKYNEAYDLIPLPGPKNQDIATTTRVDVNKSRQRQRVGNTEEKSEAKNNPNKKYNEAFDLIPLPGPKNQGNSANLNIIKDKKLKEISLLQSGKKIGKLLRCNVSDYKCPLNALQMVNHSKQHTSDKTLKKHHAYDKSVLCTKCGYKAVSQGYLNKHMKIHSDEKPFACTECNYRSVRKSTIIAHMKIHSNEKPFSCDICGYRCISKNMLQKHLRIHTGEKPFKCDVCDYSGRSSSALNLHNQHKHTSEKKFSCDICSYKCRTNALLKIHLNIHASTKPYICEICGHTSAVRHNLKVHMKIHLTAEDKLSKLFFCDFCGHNCKVKSALVIHMRIHTGEKPFSCHLCDYKSRTNASLKRHMLTHTGEKPLSCDWCNFRCIQKPHLQKHIKHTHLYI